MVPSLDPPSHGVRASDRDVVTLAARLVWQVEDRHLRETSSMIGDEGTKENGGIYGTWRGCLSMLVDV